MIGADDKCFICGRSDWLEVHHIFPGALRKKSDKYGFTVCLCHWCHNEPPNGVHQNKEKMRAIQRIAQKKFEKTHTRNEFIKEFYRNYL